MENGLQQVHHQPVQQCLKCTRSVWLVYFIGWKKEEMNIDIVPLFETIDDLQNASVDH